MKRRKILSTLIIALLVISTLSTFLLNTAKANPPEASYPPILNPLPEMRFQVEQDVVLEISAIDFNLDDELTLTTESIEDFPNPFENGASISQLQRENELWRWQFNWHPLPNQIGEETTKYKFLAKVEDSSSEFTESEVLIDLEDLNQEEFISTPVLTTNPYYAAILNNRPSFSTSYIRPNQEISIKAFSKSSVQSTLEYKFTNGNSIIRDWDASDTVALSFQAPGYNNINVLARSVNAPEIISQAGQIAISVKNNDEILPPQIQKLNPKQIGTATFNIKFYSNPENAGMIENYVLKIGRFGAPPIYEYAINVPDPNNEEPVYESTLDMTSAPELLDLVRQLHSRPPNTNNRPIVITIFANVSGVENLYTYNYLQKQDFPEINNLSLENITRTTADIFVEATNPGNFYNVESFRIYKNGELDPIAEFPNSQQPYTLTNLEPNVLYQNAFYIRPVHNANNIEIEGSAKYLPDFQTEIDPGAFDWIIINHAFPLDTEPSWVYPTLSSALFFSSLKTNNYIYFTYTTESIKNILTRFNMQENKFEIWTGNSWSSDANALPESISHSMGYYTGIKLFTFPENEDSLFGTAVATYKLGAGIMDTHGTATNFRFQNNEFKQWSGGVNYRAFFFKSLIDSWVGSGGERFDFAFDPETKKGIAVGIVGKPALSSPVYKGQLTAALYNHDDTINSWYRWNNGSWIPNTNWPGSSTQLGQPVWILNPSIPDASLHEYGRPIITHVAGTQNFLVTFIYDKGLTKNLASALYKGDEEKWYHWTNNKWQYGAPYNYTNLNLNTLSLILDKKQISLPEQKVSLIFLDAFRLYETVYDNQIQQPSISGAWSETRAVNDHTNVKEFILNKDSQDTLYLVYKGPTSNIYLIKKPLGENWTTPETIYAFSEETHLAGIEFTNENLPIVFISKEEDDTTRLYALSEDNTFWENTEIFNINSLPSATVLNTELISHNASADVAGMAGNIAIDDDGYIYSPQSHGFSTFITKINQENFSSSTSKRWGAFAGYFHFPGGADVYEEKSTVYISNRLVGINGGSSLEEHGYVTAWNYAPEIRDIRNENLFAGTFGVSGSRPMESFSYGEQIFAGGLAWPSDVTVDDIRGLLIISDSANNRLRIYDIYNLTDLPTNQNQNFFARRYFLTTIANLPNIVQIEEALIREGYIGSFTNTAGEMLYWITHDEQATLNFVRSLPEWQSISPDFQKGSVLRVLLRSFKTYRQVPRFVNYFGEEGSELGQFKFPQGHDIGADGSLYIADSENHRIQKFQFNEAINNYEPILEWGVRGQSPGEFISPIGISVDKLYNIVFVTDPVNNRIQIFTNSGEFITEFSSWVENNEEISLTNNVGIAAQNGNFYVPNNNKIEKFSLIDNAPEFSNINIIQRENSFDLEIEANDDWGITFLTILIDNETFQTIEINYERNLQTTLTIPLTSLENHTITLILKDAIQQQTQTQIINGQLPDLTPPEVFNLIPQPGAAFTLGATIEISADVTDNVAVENVIALLTQPDSTTLRFDLTNVQGNKYSALFTPNILGDYSITFVAVDTSNNTNSNMLTSFTITQQITPPGPGGGGGGGGNRGSRVPPIQNPPQNISLQTCAENWICEPWSQCENSIQTRQCYDINNCGTFNNAPRQERTCFTQQTTPEEEGLFSKAKTTALAILGLNKATTAQKAAALTITLIVLAGLITLVITLRKRR